MLLRRRDFRAADIHKSFSEEHVFKEIRLKEFLKSDPVNQNVTLPN